MLSPEKAIAARKAAETLIHFINPFQMKTMRQCLNGEEGEFFADKFIEFAERVEKMPKSYETDGQGNNAVAHLRYFNAGGAGEWYITEKDKGEYNDKFKGAQIQAFGLADLGMGAELGYISIHELINLGKFPGIELDLHFTPTTIGEIRKKLDY